MSGQSESRIPAIIRIVSSGKHFWHRDYIGKELPVVKVLKTHEGLYFHVDPGIKRPKGAMENIPFGISEQLREVVSYLE